MTERRNWQGSASPPELAFAGIVEWQGLVFVSGCLGNLPGTRQLADGGFQAEAEQVFADLAASLAEAELAPMDADKVTVYLTVPERFALVDAMSGQVFGRGNVARTTVEVSRLGLGAARELDAIAARTSTAASA